MTNESLKKLKILIRNEGDSKSECKVFRHFNDEQDDVFDFFQFLAQKR